MRFEEFKDLAKVTFPDIDTVAWVDTQDLYESLLVRASYSLPYATGMHKMNLYSFFNMVTTQLHNIDVTGNTIWDKPKENKK